GRHDRDVWFGAHPFARNGTAGVKRSSSAGARPPHPPLGGSHSPRQVTCENVALLRRSARAFPPDHRVVDDARNAPEALRHLFGRRPRDHGSGEPRRGGRRWLLNRAQHPASARAAPESLYHRRPEFLLSLLFYAQAVVRPDGESADRVSRRIWHDGRAI